MDLYIRKLGEVMKNTHEIMGDIIDEVWNHIETLSTRLNQLECKIDQTEFLSTLSYQKCPAVANT